MLPTRHRHTSKIVEQTQNVPTPSEWPSAGQWLYPTRYSRCTTKGHFVRRLAPFGHTILAPCWSSSTRPSDGSVILSAGGTSITRAERAASSSRCCARSRPSAGRHELVRLACLTHSWRSGNLPKIAEYTGEMLVERMGRLGLPHNGVVPSLRIST